jgi:hypothetical protein
MSTLKTINIIHPSGSTNNIVNDASGNVTVGNNLTVTGTFTGSTGVMNIGSGQLYKDASGNVGIGTSSPAGKLEVSSANNIVYSTGTAGFGAFYARGSGTSNSYLFMGNATSGEQGRITTENGGAIAFANTASATERMRIDSSGNVGIGTSAPGVKLDVSGQRIRINNASDPGIELWNGSVAKGYVFYDTTNDLVTMRHASTGTGASINSSGNLLVGTTTINTARLNVTAATEIGAFQNTSGTGNVRFLNSGGSTIGYIQWSGASTSYVTSSDYRLKENVAPITSGLATVSALKPVTYKWKEDGSVGEGFVAHELQEIIPFAVTGSKDELDENGNPEYQGVDYSKIVVHLVAACQELKAQNDELKARVAALENA